MAYEKEPHRTVIQVSQIAPDYVRKNGYSIENIPQHKMRECERTLFQHPSIEDFFERVDAAREISDCRCTYYTWEGHTQGVGISGRSSGKPFLWLLTHQRVVMGTLAYVHAIDKGRQLQEQLDWPYNLDDYPQWKKWVQGNSPVYPGGRDKPATDPLSIRLWNWFAPKQTKEE